MKPLPRLSLAEQTAAHLRDGIHQGRWIGHLPGVLRLAEELAVSKGTLRSALRLLERDGSLQSNRSGQRRSITERREEGGRRLRVGVLLSEPLATENSHSQNLMNGLRQAVEASGHVCFFTDQSLLDLRFRTEGMARVVRSSKADAWVLYGAPREALVWFAKQALPVFCIGGRVEDLPLSTSRSDTAPGIRAATQEFLKHGHRRIVFIAPTIWREPQPNLAARAFLEVLHEHQMPASPYNLPQWEESPAGLRRLLGELFFATPPTGLLTVEPGHALAVMAFLARRGLRVPEDVSLMCALEDPIFEWHEPSIACLRWSMSKHIRSAVDWLQSVAAGSPRIDTRVFPTVFEPGGSIGPARVVQVKG